MPIPGKGARESELIRGTVGREIGLTSERISETIAPTDSRTVASVRSNARAAATKCAINSATITLATIFGETTQTRRGGD